MLKLPAILLSCLLVFSSQIVAAKDDVETSLKIPPGQSLPAETWERLAKEAKLLSLSGRLSAADWSRLGRLTSLENLELGTSEQLDAQGVPQIAKLTHLKTLHIHHCGLTGENMALLAKLPELEFLYIHFCSGLKPEALSAIATFPALRRLRLTTQPKFFHALPALAGHPKLEDLYVEFNQAELEAVLDTVAPLPALKQGQLGIGITSEFKNIVPLSDAQVAKLLMAAQLTQLTLKNLSVTPEQARRIQVARPELKLSLRWWYGHSDSVAYEPGTVPQKKP